RRIDIVIERGGNLPHSEWCEEAIIDAVLEGINIHRLAEIGVGIDVFFPLGCGGESEVHDRGEIGEDVTPGAFIIGTTTMTFIDDDKVEEVGRILTEIR